VGEWSQTTCTLEKLVFEDKQVGFEIKGYENKKQYYGQVAELDRR
jgi:hypothetical protein